MPATTHQPMIPGKKPASPKPAWPSGTRTFWLGGECHAYRETPNTVAISMPGRPLISVPLAKVAELIDSLTSVCKGG